MRSSKPLSVSGVYVSGWGCQQAKATVAELQYGSVSNANAIASVEEWDEMQSRRVSGMKQRIV